MVIERVVPNEGAFLLEREDMWIKRLETKKPHGLNRNDWTKTEYNWRTESREEQGGRHQENIIIYFTVPPFLKKIQIHIHIHLQSI